MKNKIINAALCLTIICILTVSANASYTQRQTAHYWSGYTYPPNTQVGFATKRTSNLGNAILAYQKTSWTVPRLGICDATKTAMTVLSPTKNSKDTAICMTSMAEVGKRYSIMILGSPNQHGEDTMIVSFDLDAEEPRPVAGIDTPSEKE